MPRRSGTLPATAEPRAARGGLDAFVDGMGMGTGHRDEHGAGPERPPAGAPSFDVSGSSVRANRSLWTLLALGVGVAAILGYVLGVEEKTSGHARKATATAQGVRTAIAGSVLVELPPGWSGTPTAVRIPHLAVSRAVVLAPSGDPTSVALVAGELPGGEPSPLPRAFVARLRGQPITAVVTLSHTEAYRYTHLSLPRFDRRLVIYAIPRAGGSTTVLACSVASAAPQEIRTCEQIVSTARSVGQVKSESLTPDPAYAQRVTAAIGALERKRVELREEMQTRTRPAAVRHLATRLARTFEHAAATLAVLEPSLVAAPAQAALSRAIADARGAYVSLAAAARSRDAARYDAARTRVYAAEAAVGAALENYALLGYARG